MKLETNFLCFLGDELLENILKIMEEGNKTFGTMSALKKWSIDKVRHTANDNRPHS